MSKFYAFIYKLKLTGIFLSRIAIIISGKPALLRIRTGKNKVSGIPQRKALNVT